LEDRSAAAAQPARPFNLQNYFFGATDIDLVPYTVSTFFGIMPGSAIYVYLGTLGRTAADNEGHGLTKIAFRTLGFIATAVVIFLVGRKARTKLQDIVTGGWASGKN
jgi:uncharacterized membrane protein YdjX (TVP38/TMEM64 family)